MSFNLSKLFSKRSKQVKGRSLRVEGLEDRMLLAVTAGGEAAAAELVAPAETGAAEVVVTNFTVNGLRAAINQVDDGGTITFDGSGTIVITSALQINKNLTINGGGDVILQGAGENILFMLQNNCKSLTLTGLGISNGATTSSSGNGGVARVSEGVTVTLNDCDVYGNRAQEGNNTLGGAFHVSGTLNMNGCNVYDNHAEYGGFATISGQTNNATINAENCNFYGNSATGYGAVIANIGGILNLTNCSVVANSSPQGAIYDSNYFVVNGTSDPDKWDHSFYICDTHVTNSIFAYNDSTDPAGADIYEAYNRQLYGNGVVRWAAYDKEDTFTKVECVNSLIGQAGDYFVQAPVLDADGNVTNLDAVDLTIKSDSIAAYAGIGANPAAYTGGELSLVVTTLDDVSDNADGQVSLREAIAYATVGTFDGTPTITFADGLAGGVITLAEGQLAVTSDLNIEGAGVTVDADGQSRVLYLKSNTYQMDIEGHSFSTLDLEGGVPVHNHDDYNISVAIDNMNFTGGAVTVGVAVTGGGAGILAVQNAFLNLSNSTVSGNTLYTNDQSNASGACGGGGLAATYYGELNLDNVRVVENRIVQTGEQATMITELGGGIFIGIRGSLNANETTVSNNELTSEYYVNSGYTQWGYGYGRGAGIYSEGDSTVITNSEICDNTTVGCAINQYGGGIYYYNLGDNYVGSLGPARADEEYGLVLANTKITGNSLGDHRVENNGFCQGGGIFNSGKAILVNCLIADNVFDAGNESVNMTGYINGAGIYNAAIRNDRAQCWDETVMDIYYCTITHNTAACIDYSGYATDSVYWGGGIYSFGDNANNDPNRRNGGKATLNLIGSILYHNYVKNSGTEATSDSNAVKDDSSTFVMSNTLYNTGGYTGNGFTYEDCIKWMSRNKAFNDEAAGDYTLWAGNNPSQALDALKDTAPVPPAAYVSAYDLHGEPWVRVYNDVQDLGCYEYQPTPTPTPQLELELTAYTGIYDGAAHTITISGVQEGDVVTYSADGVNYGSQIVTYTDAGAGTVYVKAQREGYKDFSGSAAVTISAKALTISGTKVADKVYDGTTDAVVTLGEVSGIVAGDDVTVTADAAFPLAEVGEYDVTVTYTISGASASNYAAPAADVVTASITEQGGGEQLAAPTITTGNRGIYVSYGANRHNIQWGAVANASGYEVQYTVGGSTFGSVSVTDASAVITGLVYGTDVTYQVRALGDGVSYTDSEWSASKTFNVCPMDINNDGDISGSDRNLLASSWLSEEGDDEYQYYADINGDGDVSGADRNFVSNNWLAEAGDEDLTYPRPLAADAVFAAYEAGDLDVDFDVF